MTKYIYVLNHGSETLDEILEFGKSARDLKGIGFEYGSLNSKPMCVPLVKKTKFNMSNNM